MALVRSAAASALSMCVGDLVCQHLETRQQAVPSSTDRAELDLHRTGRMAVTGLLVSGPLTHGFFRIAEHVAPGTALRALLIKGGLDLASAPLRITAIFATVIALQHDLSLTEREKMIRAKLANDLVPTYVTGASIFPPIMFLNFKFVAESWRPSVWAAVGACWNVYLSYQANSR